MSWPARADKWSDEERAKLAVEVARAGDDWTGIAANMPGRSPHACKQAYNSQMRRLGLAAANPVAASAPKRLKSWQDKRGRAKAAEQERLQALELQRSLTAEFFGDPLPGRSALDRKCAGIVDPEHFDRRMMHVPKKPTLFTGEVR